MEGTAGRHEPQDLGQQRRAMLAALEEAVLNEDYEFATQIAASQVLLDPTDLVEYMDVKRRGTEDPVEQRRWGDGIINFWSNFEVHQFTPDEIERLEAVKKRMEFDSIVSNKEEADVTSIDEAEEKPGWEEDVFYVDLSEEEIERIRQSPVFMQAEHEATGNRGVYADAEPDLDKAYSIVARYASDAGNPGEITEMMHRALDKHIIGRATREATGNRGVYADVEPDLDKAKSIIEQYASSPERAKAMLRELGFM